MLVSLFIKEKLYIGEATVATICGIIFGPSAAGLFDPQTWGNVDQITLEASRIVLVVQCFAVGVELPKKYMERHWKSVVFLLIPVMTWGWLITSLIIWWMIPSLNWLDSLTVAACVTATDPVLASSVVGKGKFARRIPKHLRDILSAESGCNDGMAFPFIYLALYLIKYRPNTTSVFYHWFCFTVLYECLFGAVYGACIGYAGRRAIRWAEGKNIIDRESFLVFYFTLALWCAGTGSMLGLDDLLVGFCAGVAFSNDGWFAQKTEESHVSNVIDLLLNLAYFVYFGSIIPWTEFNKPSLGITPWRLVVIALFVILFRRIPIMVVLKPVIPDIKTWREALFAGHFGPIGVGAIFVAILARAELETSTTTPSPRGDFGALEQTNKHFILIALIWPITCFLVISSIVVHGSSIAVFTLGKHINTMKITMSYTTANEEPNWLARLPRLTPRTSMSIRKPDTDESLDEKLTMATDRMIPPGTLPAPGGIPGGFMTRENGLRDTDNPAASRPASIRAKRRRNWESGMGPGGPISDSAIAPRRRRNEEKTDVTIPETAAKGGDSYGYSLQPPESKGNEIEAYREGRNIIVEDGQGNVLEQIKTPQIPADEFIDPLDATRRLSRENQQHNEREEEGKEEESRKQPPKIEEITAHEVTDERSALRAAREENKLGGKGRRREPAWAYRFDDNIVVEDEDGEVIRRYKLPKSKRSGAGSKRTNTLENFMGFFKGGKKDKTSPEDAQTDDDNDDAKTVYSEGEEDPRGKGIHFRMHDERGRKMSKQEFLHQLQKMDPHARAAMGSTIEPSEHSQENDLAAALRARATSGQKELLQVPPPASQAGRPKNEANDFTPPDGPSSGSSGESLNSGYEKERPVTSVKSADSRLGDERDEETAAERKRREAALGITGNDEPDSDDDGEPGWRMTDATSSSAQGPTRSPGIRFADQPRSPSTGPPVGLAPRGKTLSWGKDVVVGKGKGRE
ncbi:Sodium/hydrogen exchanger family-domain-containing protein [Tuber brumale]|nr:Sodium/hydrogen exchanger family-domain-containing protein [Tuber brumale]